MAPSGWSKIFFKILASSFFLHLDHLTSCKISKKIPMSGSWDNLVTDGQKTDRETNRQGWNHKTLFNFVVDPINGSWEIPVMNGWTDGQNLFYRAVSFTYIFWQAKLHVHNGGVQSKKNRSNFCRCCNFFFVLETFCLKR